MRITSFAGIIVALPSTFGLDNGLALTPPMGWRSWNCDHIDVSDVKIRATIDAIVSRKRKNHNGEMTSLADVGFGRVGVDDGWQACGTGVRLDHTSFHAWDGTPLINASTFPSLKEMVKYGHAAGVKMGWYLNNCYCMDEYTMQEVPVWAQRCYEGDAKLVEAAGFDGVKIDNCGDDRGLGYIARLAAINASGHALLVENSNQGKMGNPRGNPTNDSYCPYNFFRSGGDIGPDFNNVISKLQRTLPYLGNETTPVISRPGCWAYPDMLEVGNFGVGQDRCEVVDSARDAAWYASVPGQLAVTESRTHFGAWCIVSSPLILGLDVTDDARLDSVWDIVSNTEAIAVNQAWAGEPGRLVAEDSKGTWQLWSKIVATTKKGKPSAVAALLFNRGGETRNASTVDLDVELGLKGQVTARNIWTHSNDTDAVRGGTWAVPTLSTHDSVFYLFTVTGE